MRAFCAIQLRVHKGGFATPLSPEPIKGSFGWKLRQKRLDLGLTLDEMAKRLTVPRSTLSHWELGNRRPSDSIASAFSEVRSDEAEEQASP